MSSIVGLTWDQIQRLQQKDASAKEAIDTARQGDYGADPIGDGKFRMVPSGDVVDMTERNKRLERKR